VKDSVRARLVASGRVQGVAFRAATVDEAQRIGHLRGWVRNLPDGRVEALVEGERPAVEALVAWCRRGPRSARVDDLQVSWEAARGDLGPFDIAF
jgi:acylphosphatase